MTDLEKLLALEEIKQIRPRYFRACDEKLFDEFDDMFTEDAVFDSREAVTDPVKGIYPGFPESPVSVGKKAIIEGLIAGLPESLQSCHMGHVGEFEITSDTTAKGIVPLSDRLVIPGVLATAGYGYYYDEYEKVDGKWKIKSSVLKRKRVIFEDDLGNAVDLSGK